MSKYRVIWIDDEWDEQLPFINECKKTHDIEIIPFKTSKDGMIALESNINSWDAIILDVEVYNETENEVVGTKGFHNSIKKIESLSSRKKIPYFISTGKDAVKSSAIFKDQFERIYIKDVDDNELIRDLIASANSQVQTQIRHKYYKVFNVLSNDLIGQNEILEILMSLHGHKEINPKTYYTQLRLILECIFRDANKRGLLHDKCVAAKVNLTESSLFLAGEPTKHLKVKCTKPHFPKLIADNVKSLLFITGGASHTTEQDEKSIINLQDYWNSTNSPYLLYSQTLILCDILLWYKQYSVANSCKTSNQALWEDIVEIVEESEADNILKGKIINVLENGLAFLKPNGSTNRSENCSVNQKCRECRNIDVGDELKVEFEEKDNRDGNKIRVATKILEHKPKIKD